MNTKHIAEETAKMAAESQSINDNYTPEFLEIFFRLAIEKAVEEIQRAAHASENGHQAATSTFSSGTEINPS